MNALLSPEFQQLLNVLIIPAVGLLWRISNQLAAMQSTQVDHARRLHNLEGHHQS